MCVAAILNLHHLFQLLLENTILIFLQNMAHKLIIRFEAQVTVQQFLTGLPVLGFGGCSLEMMELVLRGFLGPLAPWETPAVGAQWG